VNLLLILSALLSAFSGVGQAVRDGRTPQAVCATVAGCAVAVGRRAVASRPQPALPTVMEVAVAALAAWRLRPAEPIFAGRRRE